MGAPVTVITGAGSGIGRATAELLTATGHQLVVVDRDEDGLSETRKGLVAKAEAIVVAGDVADQSDVGGMAQRTHDHFGRLDAVVANAGINGVWGPIEDLMPSEWDETIRINLRGIYLMLHKAVPVLKRAESGAIVIVSSLNGLRTFTNPGATGYGASKAAQVAMAQQRALELGKHRIPIDVVCPERIETNIVAGSEIRNRAQTEVPAIWPQGSVPLTDVKPGQAIDDAQVIRFLLTAEASHMTGSPVLVDGGPGVLR